MPLSHIDFQFTRKNLESLILNSFLKTMNFIDFIVRNKDQLHIQAIYISKCPRI